MEPQFVARLVADLVIILSAGLAAGIVCRRLGVSVLVGYLVAGTLVGGGALGLTSEKSHELHYLAEAGALLLLFSIGIEFSLDELARLKRYFLLGGSAQMVLVGVPATLVSHALGLAWAAAILVGSAAALSSTVLVFKALEEWGQVATPHGRRATGILLFQDVALVPLMLLVPLLTGAESRPGWEAWAVLAANSVLFVLAVVVVRWLLARWIVPLLAAMRSRELVILFTMAGLGGASLAAYGIGLPPALGAFAAGLILSGNRLTAQVDALILPFRETFAAVFFVGLGTLMRFDVLVERPLLAAAALGGVLVLKTAAAAAALRMVGLAWRAALAMGLGLSQMGELSFMLLSAGVGRGVVAQSTYELMLFVALGTLIATPQLVKFGLRTTGSGPGDEAPSRDRPGRPTAPIQHAVIIGLGPVGRQIASRLETTGVNVCLVDLNPINLYPFAQQGFRTVTGNAANRETLQRAEVEACSLVVMTVPDDRTARQIVATIRTINRGCTILVRCRYVLNRAAIEKAGATAVMAEEEEASGALLRLLEDVPRGSP